MSVRLVDNSKEKAKNVANELGDSIVMNADATDVEFLKNENIGDVDSFISVFAAAGVIIED
jgi:trk system potassium uptake protein TrkA